MSTTFSRVLAMLGFSFRSFPSAVLPRAGRGKQLAVSALAAAFLAGCGSPAAKEETQLQRVQGAGYSFRTHADWRTTRTIRTVQATGRRPPSLVSVSVFPLARPYVPAHWTKAVAELDGVARALAVKLHVPAPKGRTATIAGRRARRYELSSPSAAVRRRIAFVLDGKSEYQLFCRFRAADADAEQACETLMKSFRLT